MLSVVGIPCLEAALFAYGGDGLDLWVGGGVKGLVGIVVSHGSDHDNSLFLQCREALPLLIIGKIGSKAEVQKDPMVRMDSLVLKDIVQPEEEESRVVLPGKVPKGESLDTASRAKLSGHRGDKIAMGGLAGYPLPFRFKDKEYDIALLRGGTRGEEEKREEKRNPTDPGRHSFTLPDRDLASFGGDSP